MDERFLHSLDFLGIDAAKLAGVLAASEASVSVRVNTSRGLTGADGLGRVPWCPAGFYLPERPLFAADPQWHQGLYYVQEASSMAAGAAMRQLVDQLRAGGDGTPLRVLDACAAPGGKTIGITGCLGEGDLVVANEADGHRCNVLLENVARWGCADVAVTRSDARSFGSMPEAFDIIAADVPCSGEGMMRKEDEAVRQWSPALVQQCAALQRDIVEALWAALRPGGFLLYSTCTFNDVENEGVVRSLAADHGAIGVELDLGKYQGVLPRACGDAVVYRFMPGRVRGEGFAVCALRKPGSAAGRAREGARRRAQAPRAKGAPAAAMPFLPAALLNPERYLLRGSGSVEAVRAEHGAFVDQLAGAVRVVRGGLPVAERRGSDLIPTHEALLALGVAPDGAAAASGLRLPALEVDLPAAYSYLKGNALTGIGSVPKGIFAVLHGGYPLGLAKGVGRRANNLLPPQLRLRLSDDALRASVPTLTKPLVTEQ